MSAVALVDDRGLVLMQKRHQNSMHGGLWEFPGGKQDPNESLAACLKRELQEELGVEVKVGAPLGAYDHAYTHFRITVHAFEAEIKDGEPLPLDHDELVWVSPSHLARYPMGKIDRAIAQALAAEDS